MAEQIIKQPDGRLAVFSVNSDSWLFKDVTPDLLKAWYAQKAADEAYERTEKTINEVLNGDPRRIYGRFVLSYDVADGIAKGVGEEGE
jgi:hypothetical protein